MDCVGEPGRPPRVLVVEDDPGMQDLYRSSLGGDFELVFAGSAAAARSTLAEESDGICAALVDHGLPGENGLSLVAAIAEEWPWIVRIMVTGADDPSLCRAAVNAGHVFAFFTKPANMNEVQAMLFDAVQRVRRGAERFRVRPAAKTARQLDTVRAHFSRIKAAIETA